MNKLSSKSDKYGVKILFLGYHRKQTKLIDSLIFNGHEIWQTSEKIDNTSEFEIALSFGYSHILKGNVLNDQECPIVNLHLGYLPYNRGAYPNFWSFYDGTPSGVTIHLIDEGIDTGNILFQRYVNFDNGEKTFADTYNRLLIEIETLFLENSEVIISKQFNSYPQIGVGTYHNASNLPKEFSGWEADIKTEIARLNSLGGSTPNCVGDRNSNNVSGYKSRSPKWK